jgi:hypothetical protein
MRQSVLQTNYLKRSMTLINYLGGSQSAGRGVRAERNERATASECSGARRVRNVTLDPQCLSVS